MKVEIVRVLRVIEYEGPRNWVEQCIATRGVKGEYRFGSLVSPKIIREAILGELPAILKERGGD